jgi:predicted acetyltransferase
MRYALHMRPPPSPGSAATRPIGRHEFDAFCSMLTRAFGSAYYQEDVDVQRAVFEPERSLAVVDDGRFVAGTASYSLRMALPGGPAPVAGVTLVGVLPDRRRRGLLSSLMSRQLHELHETGGEPVAALWASEPGIYRRYGYAPAAWHLDLNVPRQASSARDGPGGAVRLADDLVHARADLARVYDALWPDRVGHFARTPSWWDMALHDPEHERQGLSSLSCVLHYGTDAAVDGYALYSTAERWDPSGAAGGIVRVREVVAGDPAATAALWSYLLDMDLMAAAEISSLAVDDPLLHLLGDVRQAQPRVKDGLWVRLVDVGRALSARRYTAPLDVVFDVTDELCGWNAGRWRLQADGDGAATCEETSAAADLAVDVTHLAAAYLGGTSLAGLAAAGGIAEHRTGRLRAASTAFGWHRAPHCPQLF